MAATKGTLHFWYADVDYAFEPTARDQVGCDGLYIEQVRATRFVKMFVGLMRLLMGGL